MSRVQYNFRLTDPTAAASGDNTLFTVDESQQWVIRRIKAVNNGTSKVTAKFGINASTDGSLILPTVSVPAKGLLDLPTTDILTDGESLIANCSATGLTITVYGTKTYQRHF